MIDIIVARVLISILDFTLIIIIRRIFVIMYINVIKTLKRVIVFIKGILKRI
jgi:hypothetical protein